jgi:hypothetical protein
MVGRSNLLYQDGEKLGMELDRGLESLETGDSRMRVALMRVSHDSCKYGHSTTVHVDKTLANDEFDELVEECR